VKPLPLCVALVFQTFLQELPSPKAMDPRSYEVMVSQGAAIIYLTVSPRNQDGKWPLFTYQGEIIDEVIGLEPL